MAEVLDQVIASVDSSPDESVDDQTARDEFQAMLDGEAPAEETAPVEAAPAQTTDSGEPLADDAGPAATEEATAPPVEAPPAEGPTFLMRQEAARAGLPDKWINTAVNDQQLQQWIELAREQAEAEPLDSEAHQTVEDLLKLELSEDDYPADDPLRKALSPFVEKLNGRLAQERKTMEVFLDFAKKQIEKNEKIDLIVEEREQKVYADVYGPLDNLLDSCESEVFGSISKGVNDAQFKERAAVADYYNKLKVHQSLPAAEKDRLADLALRRHRPDIADKKQTKQTASQRQAQRVIGSGGDGTAKAVASAPSEEDLIAEMQAKLDGKAPWDAD